MADLSTQFDDLHCAHSFNENDECTKCGYQECWHLDFTENGICGDCGEVLD